MWWPKFASDLSEHIDDGEETTSPVITPIAMLKGAVAIGVVAFLFFMLFPGTDLVLAKFFYLGDGHFLGGQSTFFQLLRRAFNVLFYTVCTVTLVGLIMTGRSKRPWLDLRMSRWLFVALCLIMGPLVVANIGFKDHWGRARPRDVIEFAGTKAFSPPFPPARQCNYNCSFVSGEASSIFILLFIAALLFETRSRDLAILGVILGGLSGLTRMSQGGHFFSDVVFAGVTMAITAAAIKLLFDTLDAERIDLAERGPAERG
jgi:lipid A 4'-phosphatase